MHGINTELRTEIEQSIIFKYGLASDQIKEAFVDGAGRLRHLQYNIYLDLIDDLIDNWLILTDTEDLFTSEASNFLGMVMEGVSHGIAGLSLEASIEQLRGREISYLDMAYVAAGYVVFNKAKMEIKRMLHSVSMFNYLEKEEGIGILPSLLNGIFEYSLPTVE